MTYDFYKADELKRARKEKELIVPVFSLTTDNNSAKHIIKVCGLAEDWVWQEQEQ